MSVLITVLHILSCVGVIIAIMFQVTKSEGGGGGMGWGTIGGKRSSTLHTRYGLENYLNRLTTWIAVAFMFTSALVAMIR